MRYKTTKDIYRMWLRLKGSRSAPDRQDLNPADLGQHLGDVLLLERTEGEIRFRIAGARICALMGGELRGTRFTGIFSHHSMEDAVEVLAAVEEDALPVIAGISAHFPDRFSMEGELILLPFTHARGKSGDARILGALSTRVPRSHSLPPCAELEVLSFRIISEGETSRLLHGDMIAQEPMRSPDARGATLRRARFQLLDGGLR